MRCVQELAVLGHEEHDEPVGDMQECPVQVLVRVGRGRQHRGELAVARMGDEPGSQVGQREGNTVAKSFEGTSAVSDGGGAPLFEPAAVWREGCGFWYLDTVSARSSAFSSAALSVDAAGLELPLVTGASGAIGRDAAGVDGEEKQPEFGVALVVEKMPPRSNST